MHIHIFLPNFNVGGAETVCVDIANHLSFQHEVTIYLNNDNGVLKSELNTSIQIKKLRYSRSILNLFQIRSIINYDNHNKFVSFLTHMNVIVLLAAFSKGISQKIIISERNNLYNDLNGQSWLKRKLLIFLIKQLYKKAQSIICVSRGVSNSVKKFIGEKPNIKHIYNPVLKKEITTIKFQKISKKHQNFIRSRKFFLAVGRLEKQKNYHLLINAFHSACKNNDEYCLVILGKGKLLNELKILISNLNLNDKVLLTGYEENPFKWMYLAECFVLSSDYEGLPGVLIQALSISKFLISTDCKDGPSEILHKGKFGKLVPVGDLNYLSLSLLEVTQKKALFTPISDRMLSRFDADSNLAQYQNEICDL